MGKRADIASTISKGHAFDKHGGQFADLGITTREQLEDFVENVMLNVSDDNVRALSRGRVAFWDTGTATVVIYDPRSIDAGTVFRPDNGRTYFTNMQ